MARANTDSSSVTPSLTIGPPGQIIPQEVAHLVVLARTYPAPDHGIPHHHLEPVDGLRLPLAAGKDDEPALVQLLLQRGSSPPEQEGPACAPLSAREDQSAQLPIGHKALLCVRQAGLVTLGREGGVDGQTVDLVRVGGLHDAAHLSRRRELAQDGLAQGKDVGAALEGDWLAGQAGQ